jgi:hypothetical protein
VLSSDASPVACTTLTNARQSTDAAFKPLAPWILGKLGAASTSAFNISVSSTDNSVLVLKPFADTSTIELKLVNVNGTSRGITTIILTNTNNAQWNLVWMLSTSSSESSDLYINQWNYFNNNLGQNAFPTNRVKTVTQGASCSYPNGVSPPYVNADINK